MADRIVIGILRALLTADTAQFEGGMRRAATSLAQFGKQTAAIARNTTGLGQALSLSVSAPLLALGVGAAKAAGDFEQSFAGVRKTTEASEEQFGQMEVGLRNLSKQIPINVNELTHLAEIAGALGIPTDQVVEFTRVMAILGKTTNVTAEEAANAIAKIQNIFGAAGQQTEQFASALVKLGNEGASTEDQILELANRASAAGRAIGLSQADVLAFAAATANVGIEAEAGGSALSRTFTDISLAVSNGTKDLQGFARVAHMSVQDFSALFKTDARAAVLAFMSGLSEIGLQSEENAKKLNEIAASGGNVAAAIESMVGGDEDLIRTLNELGFTEVRQLNLLRALALAYGTDQGLARSVALSNEAVQRNTELNRVATARFATTWSELVKLGNVVRDVGITFGNSLLPLITATSDMLVAMLPVLEKIGQGFAALPMPVQAVVVGFGLVVAAAGPALFMFGQLAFSASQLAIFFGKSGLGTLALGNSLKGLRAAQAGLVTGFTTVTTAARASTAAMGAFGVALATIVIPAALIELQTILAQLKKHEDDQRDAQIVMGEAAKIAGTQFGQLQVAMSANRDEIRAVDENAGFLATTLGAFTSGPLRQALLGTEQLSGNFRDANTQATAYAKGQEILAQTQNQQNRMLELGGRNLSDVRTKLSLLNPALQTTEVQVDKTTGAVTVLFTALPKGAAGVAGAMQTMTAQLRAAQDQLRRLTEAQRAELSAGVQMGQSNKDIADSFNALFPKVKLNEVAIGLYRDQLQAAGTAARAAARDFAELTGAQERQEAAQLAGLLESGQLRLAAMTTASQLEVNNVLRDGVAAWAALGEAVPASVMRQLEAVTQLAAVQNDIKNTIREGSEGLKDDQRQILERSTVSVRAMRDRAESSADVVITSWNQATAAQRDAEQQSREIEFRRAQHTIEMAEHAGAHWQDVYAMERALHRARVDVAIRDEQRQFVESTTLLDRTNVVHEREYQARATQHRATVQAMEEDFLLSEQAKWDALRRTKDVWFVALTNMKATAKAFVTETTDNLLSILTGLGHDIDGELAKAAEEAKEHYDKVKRSGKSSAEAISNAFQRYREAEDRANHTFLERMRDVWLSFKSMVIQILNDLLGHFVRSFIGGMIRAAAGARLGQTVGNLVASGGGVGGAITNVAGGVATTAAAQAIPGGVLTGAAGGVGAGALATTTGFTTINAAGVAVTPGLATAGAPTAASAGAGGGALGFLSNPAFWTNPWTIGIAATGALLTFGIAKKGWFRGGEEALRVNPRRDQFQLQWAKPGDDVSDASMRLAQVLFQLSGDPNERLWKAMQRADTVKEFEAAQKAIIQFFRGHKINVKAYHTGGVIAATTSASTETWPWYRPLPSGERLIRALPGEGVITQAATTAIGGARTIEAINRGAVAPDTIKRIVHMEVAGPAQSGRQTETPRADNLRHVPVAMAMGERAALARQTSRPSARAPWAHLPPPTMVLAPGPIPTPAVGHIAGLPVPVPARAALPTDRSAPSAPLTTGPIQHVWHTGGVITRGRGVVDDTPASEWLRHDEQLITVLQGESVLTRDATSVLGSRVIVALNRLGLGPETPAMGALMTALRRFAGIEHAPTAPTHYRTPPSESMGPMRGRPATPTPVQTLGGHSDAPSVPYDRTGTATPGQTFYRTTSFHTGGIVRAPGYRTLPSGARDASVPLPSGSRGPLPVPLPSGSRWPVPPAPVPSSGGRVGADDHVVAAARPSDTGRTRDDRSGGRNVAIWPWHGMMAPRLATVAPPQVAIGMAAPLLARDYDPTRVASFAQGGFVTPGAIVPAVLHGGLYGEDITPRNGDREGAESARTINLNHYITVQGMIDRQNIEAFYRDYVIPAEKRALQLNQDDILTVHRRVLIP